VAFGGAAILANFPRAGYAQGVESRAPYSSGIESPKLKAPPNACDCHMHIYDNRFPAAANAALKPPNATVEDYRLLQKRIVVADHIGSPPTFDGPLFNIHSRENHLPARERKSESGGGSVT
jgi:hypothetical protein